MSAVKPPPQSLWRNAKGEFRYTMGYGLEHVFTAHLASILAGKCVVTPYQIEVNKYTNGLVDVYPARPVASVPGGNPRNVVPASTHDLVDFITRETAKLNKRFVFIFVALTEAEALADGTHQLLPGGHASGLLLDMTTMAAAFIDPANMTKEKRSDFKVTANVVHLNKFIRGRIEDMFAAAYFPLRVFTVIESTISVNKYFADFVPPDADIGYCIPLLFYLVHGLVLYWDLIATFTVDGSDDHERQVAANTFILHFVCRSFSHQYPPLPQYAKALFRTDEERHAALPIEMVRAAAHTANEPVPATLKEVQVKLFGEDETRMKFAAGCLTRRQSWDRLMRYSSVVLEVFLEYQLRKFELPTLREITAEPDKYNVANIFIRMLHESRLNQQESKTSAPIEPYSFGLLPRGSPDRRFTFGATQ